MTRQGVRKVPPKRTKSELMAAVKLLLHERFGPSAAGTSQSIDYLTNLFSTWDLETMRAELVDLQIARLKKAERRSGNS